MPPDLVAIRVMQAGLIDLDATVLVQLGLFLLLYLILSRVFFKPYARRLAKRDETVTALRRENSEMNERLKSLEDRLASELASARRQGMQERRAQVQAAAAERDALVAAERTKTTEDIERTIADLDVHKRRPIADMDADATMLADLIRKGWEEGRHADS